jgi:hypothetical protein
MGESLADAWACAGDDYAYVFDHRNLLESDNRSSQSFCADDRKRCPHFEASRD